ncbi:MAG: UDP-N-acetyl-D-glucosamine dehydrogenase [Ignavibacteria bacterium GWA2_54_16]|nr:MAG: UDP-N-acetyl-D-glucosamine dehydrogenase [Ignavibacteria bacterium GWA2_54_16]
MPSLENKIKQKTARIGVVGLGYVGLPLAVEYAAKGFETVGIEVDKNKVNAINAGKNYIDDVDNKVFAKVTKSGKLTAVSTYEEVGRLDVIFICVPTPFTANKEPDISYIVASTKEIAPRLRKGQMIILKSTTFPNTTEGYVQPILDESNLRVGKDYYLAFSPERIDPGNKKWNTSNTPTVVGGVTAECTRLACLVTQQAVSNVVAVSGPKVAELEKLLENIFRSVNIALVNELAQLCDRMGGVNVWEVVEAAATKPFGFMPFYPGPGIGGHCILIDPYYLSWLAREHDFQTNFITLAAETNENMPFYVKNMVQREISMMPIGFREAKILILGVAFKRDVDDIRHSPALKVVELLLLDGAKNIHYNDPHVPRVKVNNHEFQSVDVTRELLRSADCVVITTDHSTYDYDEIVKYARCVIDTRNATKNVKKGREKIVLLGDGK